MLPRQVYHGCWWIDPLFEVAFNDIDLCMKYVKMDFS
jgi:hypothetical protein